MLRVIKNRILHFNHFKKIPNYKLFVYVFCFIVMIVVFTSCQDKQEIIREGDLIQSINLLEGNGLPILLDGTFSDGEWNDALVLSVHDSINLLFKKYRDHIFIGIKCPKLIGPAIDVYLGNGDGKINQLHISAQLGERVLTVGDTEAEESSFRWGFTENWYANEFRWDESKLQQIMASTGKTRIEAFSETVYPFDGVEMQIRRAKFSDSEWLFRIEIRYPPNYDKPFIYPSETSNQNFNGWLKLLIDD